MSDDSIDFTQWGPVGTNVPDGGSGITVNGVPFTVTGPSALNTVLNNSISWFGIWAAEAFLLADFDANTSASGPPGAMTIVFETPISGISLISAAPNLYGPYTATLTAYDGPTVLGTNSFTAVEQDLPGTIPSFTYTSGSANITKIVIGVTNDVFGMAIGPTSASPPPTPGSRRKTDVAWVNALNPPVIPPYQIGAVAFDGSTTYLNTASLTASASTPYFSFSMWLWLSTGSFAASPSIFVVAPATTYTTNMFAATFDYMEVQAWDVTGAADVLTVRDDTHHDSEGAWTHFLFSCETDLAAGSKIAKFFVNGIDQTDVFGDTNPSFDMVFNALPFYLGWDLATPKFDGYMADVWIAPGQSLLSGGTIPLATIRQFYSFFGKPVNLGPNGATPTGTAPAIFLSLATGADPSTFATNLGTGGPFSVTGALSTAPSSPSD